MQDKTIIFINPGQFGYKAGYFYYCKYLKTEAFTIKFLCFDQGHPKVNLEGVEITYVPFSNKKIKRTIEWQKAVYACIKNNQSDNAVFFINYFKFCAIYGALFPKAKKVLDIRTGSIKLNPVRNCLENFLIRQTTKVYRHVTILSEGLIGILKLRKEKCHWLPLGSEVFSEKDKNYEDLRLLYVGTLNKRRIHETVDGLALFLNTPEGKSRKISYDIFGSGRVEEEQKLKQTISENNLKKIVHFHGRKNHQELQSYFDKCNVGVSYIPMTEFFEFQPPTKTFEYILSGMVCVATDTYENRKLITEKNGVLCVDSPKSFCSSLNNIAKYYKQYESGEIRQTLDQFTWQNISNRNLKPYLNQLLDENIN